MSFLDMPYIRISRLFVFFFSKYIFVSFQAVIQLALVTFVIDDLFSKVTSISRTFNIITMLEQLYIGTSLQWYNYKLTIKREILPAFDLTQSVHAKISIGMHRGGQI